jgi:hypothetical protein
MASIWVNAVKEAKAEEEAEKRREEEEKGKQLAEKNPAPREDYEYEEDEGRRKRKRVTYYRSKGGKSIKRRRRRDSSGGSSDIDDAVIVRTGKAIAGTKNPGAVFPLLSRKSQTAVRTGVRKLAKGEYDDNLRSSERKSIQRKKHRYRGVYKKGKNPFGGRYAKVGKTYSNFMREVSLKEVSDSSSSDSSDSSDSGSE